MKKIKTASYMSINNKYAWEKRVIKYKKYFRHPHLLIYRLLVSFPQLIRDDERYLRIKYEMCFGHPLDLESPSTYNEKLQWLKLYYRLPELTTLVDKVKVKDFVSRTIGEEYIIPTRYVWNSVEEINWDLLPNQFVLKTNHNSGGIVICKDKKTLDINYAISKLKKSLAHDNYKLMREWPYKNVEKKILCEDYMEDESGQLKDNKYLCFDGVPKMMFIATDRHVVGGGVKFDYFDMNFKRLNCRQSHPNSKEEIKCPECFEQMKELAAKLSKGLPHSRIDFYQINGKVYFGEITLFHFGGFTPFIPEEWDNKLGEWLLLPTHKVENI